MVLGLFLGFLYGAVIGLVLIATKLRGKNQAAARSGRSSPPVRITAILVGDSDPRLVPGQLTGRRCAGRMSEGVARARRYRMDRPAVGGCPRVALPDRRRVPRPAPSSVVVEGLPAGPARHRRRDRRRAGPPPPRLRPRARGCASSRTTSSSSAASATAARSARRSPIVIRNTEWPQVAGGDVAGAGRHREAAAPSPGPATPTSAGMQKYGFDDARDVLERASRPARPRPGSPPARWPSCCSPSSASTVAQPRHPDGRGARRRPTRRPDARPTSTRVDESPVRCFDPDAEAAMIAEIKAAAKAGDSLGGVVEVLGYGVPARARPPRALGPQARRRCSPRR